MTRQVSTIRPMRPTILLGTVAIEPARWADARADPADGAPLPALITLSSWLDPIAAAGFDGIELWERHLTAAEPAEATRILDHPLSIDVFNSYVSLDDPGVSPLFADLSGLPPMLIQTGMDEVLLSDSTRLAERAREAGVEVTLDLAEGMWHVYPAFAPLVPEATDALVRAAVFMRSRVPAPAAVPA